MTPDPAQVDVAELRALEEAATPGPWEVRTKGWDWIRGPEGYFVAECGDPNDPNAAFITAARNALPALLDRLEAAEAKVAAVRTALARAEQRQHPMDPRAAAVWVSDIRAALEQTP